MTQKTEMPYEVLTESLRLLGRQLMEKRIVNQHHKHSCTTSRQLLVLCLRPKSSGYSHLVQYVQKIAEDEEKLEALRQISGKTGEVC